MRVRARLVSSTRQVCERHGAVLVESDGESDHLHLLIEYPPKVALSRLVGSIKTNTSKRVREQRWPEVTKALWGQHFWSPSTNGPRTAALAGHVLANPALTDEACARRPGQTARDRVAAARPSAATTAAAAAGAGSADGPA